MKSLKAALCLSTAILLADPAFATSPTSLAITPGSGSAACVFSVTGSYLAPCVVMVDPTSGVAIVTAAGTSATSALGVQGVTGGTALPISGTVTANIGTVATLATAANQTSVIGTAGTPTTSVLTIQGVSGGTAQNVALIGGSAIAGKFGIDQTTVGTTNGVSIADIGANAVLAGAGATGTGSQRETVAQDTTTIAGSAPGTAGTASTNVLSVQGIASMTPLLINPGTIATWGLGTTAAGTAPTNMQLSGLVYNSAGVTLTTGQSAGLQGDANGYLEVNIKAGAGSGGTSIADNAAFTQSGTNETPIGCLANTSYTAATAGHSTVVSCTTAGSVHVTADNTLIALVNNADSIAPVTTVTTTAGNSPVNSYLYAFDGTNFDRLRVDATTFALKVSSQGSTTGGASTTGNIAANNTTAVVVKASAGTLYGLQLAGLGSAPAYLKIYNATSATCGSGTPVKRLMIPAASTAANGAGSNISFGPQGIAFGTGITYCVTTGITDTDTTAPAASTFLLNIDWS